MGYFVLNSLLSTKWGVFVENGLGQQNLSTRVADYIKEYLLFSGKYENGQKVAEHEISRALGISRSPIREAFRELQKEGLLVLVPRKGSFVALLSEQDIKEIYLMRFWIESNLYDLIIEEKRMTDADYEILLNLIKEILDVVNSDLEQTDKINEYSKRALRFHMELWALSGMKWVVKDLSRLYNQMRLAMIRDLAYAPDIRKNAYLHQGIIDSLKKGNKEEAKKLLAEDMKLYMGNK